jgi:hypothetical protein
MGLFTKKIKTVADPARQFAADLEKLIASARRAGVSAGFIARKLSNESAFYKQVAALSYPLPSKYNPNL